MELNGASIMERMQDLTLHDEKASAAPASPRKNFPLPREVKDQIYGYLLSHEWVTGAPYRKGLSQETQDDGIPLVQRRRSQACTYHFYPVILALNHEIRNEALDTLRANHFVVVSHQIVGLDVAKHWNDLPIVTEYASHVARFKQHALRIHIKAPAPLLNPIPGHHEKVKSFLMIAKDLPAFATVMRFFFYTIRPNADTLCVAKPLAAKEHEVQELTTLLPAHRGDIVTQIHLRNLAGRSPDPSVAEKWLQPLYNCIYGRQKVIVLNCEGLDDFVKSLQLAMGPKTIWPTAIAWHMLAGLRGLKQDADELAESGDYKTASIQYGKMWHLSGSYLLFHLEDVAYEMDLTFPLALVCQVLLDAATMTILLDLRTRQDSHMQFVGVLEQIGRMTSRLPYGLRRLGGFFNGVPSGQLFHASSLWMMKIMYFLSFRDAATLDDLVSTFDMIQGYAPDDERIAHDAAFVKETATNPVRRAIYLSETSTTEMFASQTAACKLPVQILNSRLLPIRPPTDVRGFVDVDHLMHIAEVDPKRAAQYHWGSEGV